MPHQDGNLQSGDILLSVNDESYEGMAVEEAQKQLTLLKTRSAMKMDTYIVTFLLSCDVLQPTSLQLLPAHKYFCMYICGVCSDMSFHL